MITTSAAGGQGHAGPSSDSGERISLSSAYLAELARRSDACSSLSSANLLGVWPRLAYMNAHASGGGGDSTGAAAPSIPRTNLPPPGVHLNAAGPSTERASSTVPAKSPSPAQSQAQVQPATTTSNNQLLGYYTPAALVHRPAPPTPMRVPEKCLTWCSQKDGAPAFCRMLCLRKRQPLATQSEALAKLRPPSHNNDPEPALNFFESLRARLAPYSIIYVRGTAEGVVGRYMEELDADDGQYDFGQFSRHAPDKLRRANNGRLQELNWGDDIGTIFYWPLTSMFSPIIDLPANVHRIVDPPARLLNRYASSFSDGTQARALDRFKKEVEDGGAKEMLDKIVNFQVRKLGEAGFFGWLEDRTRMGWFEDKAAEQSGPTGPTTPPKKDEKPEMAREDDKQ